VHSVVCRTGRSNRRSQMSRLYFAQKAFIIADESLVVIRKGLNDPNQPGKWEVPGGRMRFGEHIEEHIRREVYEEVGIHIRPGPTFYLWQWRFLDTARDDRGTRDAQTVAVARLCEPLSRDLHLAGQQPDDHIVDACWVPLGELHKYEWVVGLEGAFLALQALLRGGTALGMSPSAVCREQVRGSEQEEAYRRASPRLQGTSDAD